MKLCSRRALSLSRDDLRTRSGASGIRGSMGRNAESAVRTAQMITRSTTTANSRVCAEATRAQSRHGAAASGGMAGNWVPENINRKGNSARTAVIASCRNEARSREQGQKRSRRETTRDDCISENGTSKVSELSEGGAATAEARKETVQSLCRIIFPAVFAFALIVIFATPRG